MNPIPKYIIAALLILLALSATGNWYLNGRLETARNERQQAVDARAQADAAAKQCNDAVEGLATEAATRKKESEAEVAAAKALADAANQRADALMRKKPKYAGDDCKSAAAQVDDWLSVRRAK
jgi:hypothetical protein